MAYLLGGVVVLALLALGTTYGVTEARLRATWRVTPRAIEIDSSDEAIARGRHLSEHVVRCSGCHGEDLGGHVYTDLPGFLSVVGPNLTAGTGGVTGELSDEDWVSVIRDCVRPDGTGLVLMPCQNFPELSDADIAAIVAYVRSAAPVNREMPPPTVGLFGRLVWLFGMMEMMPARELVHDGRSVPTVDPSDPVAHGRYLARAGGCRDCHGENLSGGPMPGAPDDVAVPRNLTFHASGLRGWSEESFSRAVRDGVAYPGDRPLDPLMPSAEFSGMTDTEIHALYAYLESLPERPFGGY